MFRIRKPQTSTGLKQRVPLWIWIALLAAAVFGVLQTRYCHSQLDKYLAVGEISLETEAPSYCQVYFEVENKAAFKIKRRIIVRVYQDNLELGSKMIFGEFEPQKTKGFLTTIEFQTKILKENEHITEISVRFYD
ncbi:MAG TPA: hypothetical protein ENK03_02530 [Candidatus Cloacimonetes bacterium]|nr:hypothetical protein [Candidatus Cloacimonadota bacterium]